MLKEPDLVKIISEVYIVKEACDIYRCVPSKYISSLTSTVGTELSNNRYSRAGTLKGLYAAYEATTAMAEVEDYIRKSAILPKVPRINHTIFTMRLETEGVLDLTDEDTQQHLHTNYQELTGDWKLMNELNKEACTQTLGRVAYYSGRIAAIRYRSRVLPNKINLLVFTERITYPLEPLELPDPMSPQDTNEP